MARKKRTSKVLDWKAVLGEQAFLLYGQVGQVTHDVIVVQAGPIALGGGGGLLENVDPHKAFDTSASQHVGDVTVPRS